MGNDRGGGVGIGTILIWYFGVAYTRGGGGVHCRNGNIFALEWNGHHTMRKILTGLQSLATWYQGPVTWTPLGSLVTPWSKVRVSTQRSGRQPKGGSPYSSLLEARTALGNDFQWKNTRFREVEGVMSWLTCAGE